jgi:TatD DNase family protein
MRLFETHAHLDFPQFDQDRDLIIELCRKYGVEKIINVGVNRNTIFSSLKLAEKFDFIYAGLGFHPHDARDYDALFLRKQLEHRKVVAVGECGLDYFRNLSPASVQKDVFRDQIKLSLDLNLPLIVHCRQAYEECLQILQDFQPAKVVFHCFSADIVLAEKIFAKDWYVSFTATITYKNNSLDEVIRTMPLDRFMLETDSPYLPPQPLRGKRNSPLNLRYVSEKIAEIKGISPNQISQTAYQNSQSFYNLS